MKETKIPQNSESTIELNKGMIIAVVITLQLLHFIYDEGSHIGLDVLSSMALVTILGLGAMFGSKLLAPPPLPKRSSFDDIEQSTELVVDDNLETASESVIAIKETEDHKDIDTIAIKEDSNHEDIDTIAASVLPTQASTTKDIDNAPPPVILFNKASEASNNEDDDTIEINKWAVIVAVIILQLSYMALHIDFSGHSSPASTPPTEAEQTPTEPVATESVATTEPEPIEAAPTTDTQAAANIELLTESSSVKTPQVSVPTPKDNTHLDGILLSKPDTTKPKKEKAVTTTPKEVATTPTTAKEEPASTTDTPTETKAIEVATPTTAKDKEMAEPKVDVKTDKPTPKSLTRGLAEAQNTMGWHYYHGDGVPRNLEESLKWFKKAANLNLSAAQFNVGMMYQKGEGTQQDLSEAAKWYRKAADQNHASAQLNLGMMYISGRGVRQNIDKRS